MRVDESVVARFYLHGAARQMLANARQLVAAIFGARKPPRYEVRLNLRSGKDKKDV